MEVKRILSDLVNIDTHTDKDTFDAVNWVQQYLLSYGVESKLVYNPAKTRASIYANIGKVDKAIILNGHLDTVPANSDNWQYNPFSLTEKNGLYIGRGVCDMKGSIAAALSLVPYFIKQQANIGFVLTHDEEKTGRGCIEVLNDRDVKASLDKAAGVVVMEATDRKLIARHKNVGSVSLTMNGKAAHSSNPVLGVDSIFYLVQAANIFYSTLDEYKEVDSSFEVPTSTGIISKVQGGQAVNVVADSAMLKSSVRFMTDKARDVFLNVYCNRIKQLQREIPGLTVEIKRSAGLPALNMISKDFTNSLPFPHAKNASYYTEAGRFCEYGIPAVIFGPGNIAQAHADDEFIFVKELESFISDLMCLSKISSKQR